MPARIIAGLNGTAAQVVCNRYNPDRLRACFNRNKSCSGSAGPRHFLSATPGQFSSVWWDGLCPNSYFLTPVPIGRPRRKAAECRHATEDRNQVLDRVNVEHCWNSRLHAVFQDTDMNEEVAQATAKKGGARHE